MSGRSGPDAYAEILPLAVPTTFTLKLGGPEHEQIRVELTCLAGGGPHRPPHDTWAVRRGGWCLDADGTWVYEPIPSSRDAEFLARTRWTLEQALRRAYEVAAKEARRANR